jgi:hypothetical protein
VGEELGRLASHGDEICRLLKSVGEVVKLIVFLI